MKPLRFRQTHIGRPADIRMFDEKVYNGRIVDVRRYGRYIRFSYFVHGLEILAILDMRTDRARVLEVY